MRKFTWESLLYAAILLIAFGFRFALLGKPPLSDAEAVLALNALELADGQGLIQHGEPGYIPLTSVLFQIFDSTNFLARFWPALLGSCLVLAPILFRNMIGKKSSIILAGLLAVDPVLIATSRTAGGGMLA